MKKIDVDISEDFNFNIKTVNKINNNKRVKYVYKCIFFSPITKLDCVNSMDIYDDLLIYGTIMGNVILCHIDKNYLIPKKIVLPNGITDRENEENLKDIYLHKNKEKLFIYSNRNSHNNKTYSNMNDINNENSNEIKTAKCANKEKNEDEEKEDNGKIEKNIQNLKYDDPSPIPYPQEINLISNSSENIPCIIFDTKDNVIISMGDQELIKIEKISTLNPNSPKINCTYENIQNYDSKTLHYINCENSLCFLTSTNFLLINMTIGDINTTSIRKDYINYIHKEITNFKNPKIINGTFEANNFSVMFDFDGSKLLFVEYTKDDEGRRICIFNTLEEKYFFEYEIDKDFGHISFMRFISNNKIFLVRKYTFCEIYLINENNFILIEKWEHIGEEILSIQIYFEGTKMTKEFIENDLKNNNNNISIDNESRNISFHANEKDKQQMNKIRINNINLYNSSSRGINKRKKAEIINGNWSLNDIEINNNFDNIINDEEINKNIYNQNSKNQNFKKNEKNNFSIATLDINGNFNLYKNKKNNVLFNLYNIEGIEQIYKDQEFFFLKYPYYIAMNSKYICISTDHGIFTITKLENN